MITQVNSGNVEDISQTHLTFFTHEPCVDNFPRNFAGDRKQTDYKYMVTGGDPALVVKKYNKKIPVKHANVIRIAMKFLFFPHKMFCGD